MPRRHASTREVVKNAQLASHGKSGNPYARHPLAFKTPVLRHLDARMGFRQRSRLCFQPRPQRDKTITFKPSFRSELKGQVSETKPGSKDQGTRATYLEIIQISGSDIPIRACLGVKRCENARLNLIRSSSVGCDLKPSKNCLLTPPAGPFFGILVPSSPLFDLSLKNANTRPFSSSTTYPRNSMPMCGNGIGLSLVLYCHTLFF